MCGAANTTIFAIHGINNRYTYPVVCEEKGQENEEESSGLPSHLVRMKKSAHARI
jgi:hypothetical protein